MKLIGIFVCIHCGDIAELTDLFKQAVDENDDILLRKLRIGYKKCKSCNDAFRSLVDEMRVKVELSGASSSTQ